MMLVLTMKTIMSMTNDYEDTEHENNYWVTLMMMVMTIMIAMMIRIMMMVMLTLITILTR